MLLFLYLQCMAHWKIHALVSLVKSERFRKRHQRGIVVQSENPKLEDMSDKGDQMDW